MTKYKKPTTAQIHRAIADMVIKAMETSGANWVRSWSTPTGHMPTSMSSGKPYRGINTLILGVTRAANNYGSHHWGTYRQWSKMGAQVREGAKATGVILYKPLTVKDRESGEDKTIKMVKSFPVFNADQVDGYTAPAIADDINHAELKQPHTLADGLAARAGCDLKFVDPDRAFYSPAKDFINMPRATQFEDAEAYAATLLHELTHWTGHADRLDRKFATKTGTKDYAREELVAELGAAMMCGSLGISPMPRDDHAKYLSVWIKRLVEEPKIIFSSSADANKAAEWIYDAAEITQLEIAA